MADSIGFKKRANRSLRQKVVDDAEGEAEAEAQAPAEKVTDSDANETDEIVRLPKPGSGLPAKQGRATTSATTVVKPTATKLASGTSSGRSTPKLSFADEEDENSDVFTIKKTTASQNMTTQKNTKLHIPVELIASDAPKQANRVYGQAELQQLKKMTQKMPKPAESNAEVPADDVASKFSSSFGAKGDIPDAATIHAMKRRREMMREMGMQPDFVPLNASQDADDKDHGSRLVREEDEIGDGEEAFDDHAKDRVVFGANAVKKQAAEMKSNMRSSIDEMEYADDDRAVWESDLIKRGAGGAPIVPQASNGAATRKITAGPATINKIPEAVPIPTFAEVEKDLLASLSNMEEQHQVNLHQLESIEHDLHMALAAAQEQERIFQAASASYTFHQELRTFFDDLGDCMDEKMPQIIALEEEQHGVMAEQTKRVVERREQLILDELEELEETFAKDLPGHFVQPQPPNLDEFGRDRTAYIKAARTTRQTKYQKRHNERLAAAAVAARHPHGTPSQPPEGAGWSTDDELDDSEQGEFSKRSADVAEQAAHLFDDVDDEFKSLQQVKDKLQSWKWNHTKSYRDAYVSMSLKDVFRPFVRLEMINWQALTQATELDALQWHRALLGYGFKASEENTGRQTDDPDLDIIPMLIKKAVLPKLTLIVQSSLDAYSSKQNTRLLLVLEQINDYEIPRHDEGYLALVSAITTVFDQAIQAAIRLRPVPLLNREQAPASLISKADALSSRQFWRHLKLFKCVLMYHRLLDADKLETLAFKLILARLLLPSLTQQNAALGLAQVSLRGQRILSIVPPEWHQKARVHLAPLQALLQRL